MGKGKKNLADVHMPRSEKNFAFLLAFGLFSMKFSAVFSYGTTATSPSQIKHAGHTACVACVARVGVVCASPSAAPKSGRRHRPLGGSGGAPAADAKIAARPLPQHGNGHQAEETA